MRGIFTGNIDKYHLPSGDNAKLIERAKKRNDERDQMDNLDCAPIDELLRVSLSAFDAGLTMLSKKGNADALKCLAEGIAMVQEVERRLRVAAVNGLFTVSSGVAKDGSPMVAVDFSDDKDRVTGSRHLSIAGAKQLRDALDRAIGAIANHAESN